ncbi:MAG: hypothetical protein UR62_C0005G0012 [Candidatus Nomurabacteria bacterium GW2011_GWF2_35_12]|uniref:Uncharacterized protein n=3 Tax=Candidatus Nomuraibacteriota TaxID=1752729 RepID=A0A0G0DV54_9BACT|nr:MAG: hypothetical protein UR62_C0005G0012 [Candidatus Nomurabacteria bacterium GW2011_GWF2_35_12]KKP72411.1 MAG: hypothetical protein UR70_C0008G0003 [Candidatus Nomurabacteria bacterium GW2011_GWB1_35_20]KKP75133.1 MAG: hypothetical protein UR72_C0006G0029 [Parcubacteria group bacterium GW2011_GWC1_35_21]KKP78255.1 MAG: hypothetical protein UR77_C0005G0030 [Candidatus Nomurabacteria bacterium GW2011_GWC2_35_35]KKP88151.1 MAG: hypothetical protein UR92_C0012G0029 [Candidatus Nomurabacteria b
MRKIIHNLRRQPEEVRRHILHLFILIVTIIMVTLWIFSLGKNLANPDIQVKIKQDLKPFSILKDNIVDGYKSTIDPNTSVVQ